MGEPLVVSIPHRLGQQEALRRIRRGLGSARTDYARFLTLEEETWSDNRVNFRIRALGQSCSGTIEVLEEHVRLEVVLPWLLAKLAERIAPAIRKEGTLMLEKK